MTSDIALGQMAPDFTLPRDGGALVTLSSLRPKPVVLFAYGADGTPSCTNQVMDFNALLPEFAALGVVVLGLSKDSVGKHDKFIAKMGIKMPLLSAKDGAGKIAHIWKVDKVKGHAAEVLAHLKG